MIVSQDLLKLIGPLKLDGASPHCNNLVHQLSAKSAAYGKSDAALATLVPMFVEMCAVLDTYDDSDGFYELAAARLEQYLAEIRTISPGVFLSQSDFITSVIPEFFLRIFRAQVAALPNLIATGQKDIAIEISFDTRVKGLFAPRLQRVDVAVGYSSSLQVGDEPSKDLFIPIVAAEAKTYFDKNMITGVEYSARSFKRTFPYCLYLAIGEFADFDLSALSYASGEIDEIYILRRQKRSEWRRTGKANAIAPEIIREIARLASARFARSAEMRTSLHDRLALGKLIANH